MYTVNFWLTYFSHSVNVLLNVHLYLQIFKYFQTSISSHLRNRYDTNLKLFSIHIYFHYWNGDSVENIGKKIRVCASKVTCLFFLLGYLFICKYEWMYIKKKWNDQCFGILIYLSANISITIYEHAFLLKLHYFPLITHINIQNTIYIYHLCTLTICQLHFNSDYCL